MKQRTRVLFVCIGNSCRSPMAHGFARHKYADFIEASSAGLMPAAIIQPETYQVMSEKGVSLEGIAPTPLRWVTGYRLELVVNLSGVSVAHRLPKFDGGVVVWDVHDPIGEPIAVYREVRDRIELLVDGLASKLALRGKER